MPEEHVVRMSAAGWVFMLVSWSAITALVTFCFSILLRPKEAQKKEAARQE